MSKRIAVIVCIILGTQSGCGDAAPQGYRYAAVPVARGSAADACVVCHSLDARGSLRSAPPLWGVVGSAKARFGWYGYSPALARAGGVWSEAELDEYLADPDAFLPGTAKTLIGIPDAGQRAEIVAYLATLRD